MLTMREIPQYHLVDSTGVTGAASVIIRQDSKSRAVVRTLSYYSVLTVYGPRPASQAPTSERDAGCFRGPGTGICGFPTQASPSPTLFITHSLASLTTSGA